MSEAVNILLEALLTEKATRLNPYDQYLFKVHPSATRTQVAEAVETTFGVKVKRVNTMNVKPKLKRDRTRRNRLGSKGGMKKAIVTLKKGQSIDLATGI